MDWKMGCALFVLGAVVGLNLGTVVVAWLQARRRENEYFEALEKEQAGGRA